MKLIGTCLSVLMLTGALQAQAFVKEVDVEYDYVDGVRLKMNVYRPSNPGTGLRPGIIYTHGGCYTGGAKEHIPRQLAEMADLGITIFTVDYRKGQGTFPKGNTDIQQAVRFIRKNAARFQVNPNMLGAHGESAGGYLASMLGTRPMPSRSGVIDQYSGRVQFVSDWYGRTDFTRAQPNTGGDCATTWLGIPRNASTMKKFVDASILPYVDSKSATFHILHGTHDTQVEPAHSVLLASKLTAANRPFTIAFVEYSNHNFAGVPEAWLLTRNFFIKSFGLKPKAITPGTASAAQAINAGNSTAAVGSFGKDRFFVGGFQSTYPAGGTKTQNTSLQDLYTSVRAGAHSYNIPAKAGVYKLGLYMAEKNASVTAAGQRVFDINLMVRKSETDATRVAVPVFSGVDIFKMAGGKHKAMKCEMLYISRSGATVNVNFKPVVNHPIVAGVELLPYAY